MNFGFLSEGIQISLRKSVAVTFLASGTISMFFLIGWIGADKILFFGFGSLSAVVGSLVNGKIDRRKLLWSWVTLGVLSIVFLSFVQGTIFFYFFSVLLGISFGFGLPSCITFLVDNTAVEERTRISGIIILETLIMVFLVMVVSDIFKLGLIARIFLVAATRSMSFLALVLDHSPREKETEKPSLSVLTHRDFALYLIPWVFFNIAAGLSFWWDMPSGIEYQVVRTNGVYLFYLCMALFSVVSGIAADRFGRKPPIAIGLVIGGVSFAILSYYVSPVGFLIHYFVLGIAWGFLLVVYLAIPGDIAKPFIKEKFYALGAIAPLIVYMIIAAVPRAQFNIDIGKLSPIIMILLFLSLIPVFFAKETLPARNINERKMKEHLDKVGKIIQESKKQK